MKPTINNITMKVTAFVEKGGRKSFSCRLDETISKCLVIGYGNTAQEAIDDLAVSCREAYEMSNDETFLNLEIEYRFDVGSLFDYYSFLNIEGMASLTGISASVLRQYASGARQPREDKLKLIEEGLRKASEQLQRVVLCA